MHKRGSHHSLQVQASNNNHRPRRGTQTQAQRPQLQQAAGRRSCPWPAQTRVLHRSWPRPGRDRHLMRMMPAPHAIRYIHVPPSDAFLFLLLIRFPTFFRALPYFHACSAQRLANARTQPGSPRQQRNTPPSHASLPQLFKLGHSTRRTFPDSRSCFSALYTS